MCLVSMTGETSGQWGNACSACWVCDILFFSNGKTKHPKMTGDCLVWSIHSLFNCYTGQDRNFHVFATSWSASLQPHLSEVSCAYLYPVSLGRLMSAWFGFMWDKTYLVGGFSHMILACLLDDNQQLPNIFSAGSKPPTRCISIFCATLLPTMFDTFDPHVSTSLRSKTTKGHQQSEPPVVLEKNAEPCMTMTSPQLFFIKLIFQTFFLTVHYFINVTTTNGWIVAFKDLRTD